MLITSIQMKKIETGSKLRAGILVTLDQMIVIHDIKILQNDTELFLAMPSRSVKEHTFKDIVHPISREVRTVFERLLFGAYEKFIDSGSHSVTLNLKDEHTEKSFYDLVVDDYEKIQVPEFERKEQPKPQSDRRNCRKPKDPEPNEFMKWLEG